MNFLQKWWLTIIQSDNKPLLDEIDSLKLSNNIYQDEVINLTKETADLATEIVTLNIDLANMQKKIDQLNKALQNNDLTVKIIPDPKTLGKKNREVIAGIIANLGIMDYDLSDDWFSVTSIDEAKKHQGQALINNREWTTENHDCDNFSFASLGYWSDGFLSFAFGYARSWNHAFNVMVDDKNQLWVCEPQLNEWFLYKDRSKHNVTNRINYDIIFILM
jgi:hypothetical protein